MDVDEKVEAVVDADKRFYSVSAGALRLARRAQLYTQLQLAEASGVTASSISQAETGARRQVRALTLARLAEALDVAPAELLVGTSGSGEARNVE